jgi:hypothetical protein
VSDAAQGRETPTATLQRLVETWVPYPDKTGAHDAVQALAGTMPEKMSSDRAQVIEAWQTVERNEERIEALSRLLLDVEGSLLAYWTDIPQSEIQRLLPLIREALGDYEPA